MNALKVRHLLNRPVECFIPGQAKNAKGVIYVSLEIEESDILKNLKGAEVVAVRRFKETGNAVLLTFKQDIVPARVSLGYISLPVRQYIRPPLRCYNCQRYGHVAAACGGKKRCGKCGGSHDFIQCKADIVKCCNCGGNHVSSFRGCEHHVRAVGVEKLRVEGKISYADALKKVRGTGEPSRQVVVEVPSDSQPDREKVRQIVGTQSFLAFMVDVLWAVRDQTRRSDVIKVVVDAAERFLEEACMGPEELHKYMRQKLEVYERGRGKQKITDSNEECTGGRNMDINDDR